MVGNNQHILLGWAFPCRPVNKVGQGVGTGDVGIVVTIDVVLRRGLFQECLCRVNGPADGLVAIVLREYVKTIS